MKKLLIQFLDMMLDTAFIIIDAVFDTRQTSRRDGGSYV